MRKFLSASVILLCASVTFGDEPSTSPSTRAVDPKVAEFRQTAHLDRLAMLREVCSEANIPEETRDNAVKIMDDARSQILALIEKENASPTDDDTRKAAMKKIEQDLNVSVKKLILDDKPFQMATTLAANAMTQELAVLSRDYELIVADMEDLSLTDEQKDKLKELKLASVEKAEAPSDELSPGEVKMNAQLEFRKSVRELLGDEQKEKWKTQLAEKAKAQQKLNITGGKIIRRAQ